MSDLKIYNKLVRDRIPEIIEVSDKCCKTESLSDAYTRLEARWDLQEEQIADVG